MVGQNSLVTLREGVVVDWVVGCRGRRSKPQADCEVVISELAQKLRKAAVVAAAAREAMRVEALL